jgi:hypothetical protein
LIVNMQAAEGLNLGQFRAFLEASDEIGLRGVTGPRSVIG